MNKSAVIVVLIAICAVAAICLGVLIAVTPEKVVEVTKNPYTANGMFEILEIERESGDRSRLMAIKTYKEKLDKIDINTISTNPTTNLKYHILDENDKGHLLVLPYNINGTITVSKIIFDRDDTGEYKIGETLFTDTVKENYGLLLKYDRPGDEKYEYKIELTEGEKNAVYWISNTDNESGVRAEAIQHIREAKSGRDYTKWMNEKYLSGSNVVDLEETSEDDEDKIDGEE